MTGTHPLTYVCKFCGSIVATFEKVRTDEPAVLSFCDRPECRAQASAQYRGVHA